MTYVFGLPTQSPVPAYVQLSYRHELRLMIGDSHATSSATESYRQLPTTDTIQALASKVAPEGVRVTVPMHDIIERQSSGIFSVSRAMASRVADAFSALRATITVRAGGEVGIRHGDTIHLTPREDVIHRFDAKGLRIA